MAIDDRISDEELFKTIREGFKDALGELKEDYTDILEEFRDGPNASKWKEVIQSFGWTNEFAFTFVLMTIFEIPAGTISLALTLRNKRPSDFKTYEEFIEFAAFCKAEDICVEAAEEYLESENNDDFNNDDDFNDSDE